MDRVVQSLREALRTLWRGRTFAALVIVTQSLAFGVSTFAFSVVNGVLLAPLPYPDSNRLVAFHETWRQVADEFPVLPLNERHFEYWQMHARTLTSLAQYFVRPATLTGAGEATLIRVVHISPSLLDVLRAPIAVGRTLTTRDEQTNQPRAAILSDALWREHFGSSPSIVGRAIVLDDVSYTVVGILRPDFRLPLHHQLTSRVDALIAIRQNEGAVGWVGDHNNDGIGRLKEGATLDEARTEFAVLQAQVSKIAESRSHEEVTLGATLTPLRDEVIGNARDGLLLLLSAIVMVLLIACSNVANLSLSRALLRFREAAIRAALGATVGRLLLQVIIEQLLLASVGATLGLLIARIAIMTFVRSAPIDLAGSVNVTLDARVALFAGVTAITTALSVAILPARHLPFANLHGQLIAGGLATTELHRSAYARNVLVALQVAAVVMLLTATGLLIVSFIRLQRTELGFEPRQTLAVEMTLPQSRYVDPSTRQLVVRRVIDAIRAIPGVATAAVTQVLPLAGQGTINVILREGREPSTAPPTANYRYVSADYFRVLSIPLRRGRYFRDDFPDSAVVPGIVSESTAARLWLGLDPIGRQFRWTPDLSERPIEIVGVVADTKTNIDRPAPLMVYMPDWCSPVRSTFLVIHAALEPTTIAQAVRTAINTVDRDISIGAVRPMVQVVDSALQGRRYQVGLFLALGFVALVIATVGVYAITARNVSCRRREMNIRAALGATRSRVLVGAIRRGISPVVAGLAGGIVAADALSIAIASQLFDVRPRDPLVFSSVVALVAMVALAASASAAHSALTIDPANALRVE